MNLNLIKMLECKSVKLVIWLYGKLVREKKMSAKTKKIHIILTLKNAKFDHLEKDVKQLEPKAKPTLLLKKQMNIVNRRKSKKRIILKKNPKNAIKKKRKIVN